MTETQDVIKVEGLTKIYNHSLTAVDHINFSVKRGEIFGFLGPNGAGKTTTISMLITVTKPTAGKATILGGDIANQSMAVRAAIGVVPQEYTADEDLTGYENILLCADLYGIPRQVSKKRAEDLLKLVELTAFKDKRVQTYSGGMRRRLELACGLINRPQVLFLDEPTLGLDPQSSVEIREFIKKLNREQGTTVIVTTHMMVDADLMCDRIAIVDHGKIIALDTSTNLKKIISGADTMVIRLEIANMSPELIEAIRRINCVDSVTQENSNSLHILVHGEEAFDSIVDNVRKRNGKITSMANLQPSLEDVFLHITGHEVRDAADQKIPMEHGPKEFRAQSRVR